MDFEVVVESELLDFVELDASNFRNHYLVSIVNDFEEQRWRYNRFHNFVWDNIAETALSFDEREALSESPGTMLYEAAKNLRLIDSETDNSKGSEIAEIVLYGIMKHKYNALPVVPKIFYKQNNNDFAKGADSVHIIVDDSGEFTLWFGESKFYNSIENSRFVKVIESIKNSLRIDKLKKENSIITNLRDLDNLGINSDTVTKIKEALSYRASIDIIKDKINIPILLLHECGQTERVLIVDDEYRIAIESHHKERAEAFFRKQFETISSEIPDYVKIKFHLILFPVPNKGEIVNHFIRYAESIRGESN